MVGRFSLKTYLVLYFLTVALFYVQSKGFVKRYNVYYPYWKVLPVSLLSALTFFDGAGLSFGTRFLVSLGLLFGAIGDWLIALSSDGIITGAIAFGIGHVLYLISFASTVRRVWWGFGAGVLAWGLVVNQLCLVPLLSHHLVPVLTLMVYSVFLSLGVVLSASIAFYGSTQHKSWQQGAVLRALGFLSFYASDSLLILDHTGFQVPAAELLILSTYFTAQFFILWGTVEADH